MHPEKYTIEQRGRAVLTEKPEYPAYGRHNWEHSGFKISEAKSNRRKPVLLEDLSPSQKRQWPSITAIGLQRQGITRAER